MTSHTRVDTIEQVFKTVPSYYDRMNNLMSLGLHHHWKDIFRKKLFPIPDHAHYIDLASGTGDIAAGLLVKKKANQQWFLVDPSSAMLSIAQARLEDKVHYICAHAEALPFENNSIHTLTMSFGLRNTYDRKLAMTEMFRILEPGGQALIMEFHNPEGLMSLGFSLYRQLLPKLGELLTQDSESYTYLIDSIRQHPPKEYIQARLEEVGFSIETESLLGGLVVIYHAMKGFS